MRIGILGDGQLARMLALAAYPLGFSVLCYGTDAHGSAGQVASVYLGDYDDTQQLCLFLEQIDVLCFETENIPWQHVVHASPKFADHPNWRLLQTAQDRLLEKTCFTELGINTPAFIAIDSEQDLQNAITQIHLPAVLKTRRFGYDGKGQFVLRAPKDVSIAWQAINQQSAILEEFIAFDRELSIVAVRSSTGEVRCYDISENTHQDGILRVSRAPLNEPTLQKNAEHIATKLLNHFGYVGTFCIELFQRGDTLIANEMAPRVHNSGHWTIEGAQTSQFENHIRAITHLPLGNTQAIGYSAMINCIGEEPELETMLQIPYLHYHRYGKSARANRKVAHMTINAPDQESLKKTLADLNSQAVI